MAISFLVSTEFQFYYTFTAPYLKDLGIPHRLIASTLTLSQWAEMPSLGILLPLGLFVGLIGLAAGAYIASGPGRSQVDSLRSKTIELGGSEPVQRAKEAAQHARDIVSDPEHPVGKAIQDGVAAARRKREELEAAATRKMRSSNGGE